MRNYGKFPGVVSLCKAAFVWPFLNYARRLAGKCQGEIRLKKWCTHTYSTLKSLESFQALSARVILSYYTTALAGKSQSEIRM